MMNRRYPVPAHDIRSTRFSMRSATIVVFCCDGDWANIGSMCTVILTVIPRKGGNNNTVKDTGALYVLYFTLQLQHAPLLSTTLQFHWDRNERVLVSSSISSVDSQTRRICSSQKLLTEDHVSSMSLFINTVFTKARRGGRRKKYCPPKEKVKQIKPFYPCRERER